MSGATIAARTTGRVAQYGLSGTDATATITPFDSGTVLGTVPPGKTGIKQISGVIQNATTLTATASAADQSTAPGNALVAGQDAQGFAQESASQAPSAGLSLGANHE